MYVRMTYVSHTYVRITDLAVLGRRALALLPFGARRRRQPLQLLRLAGELLTHRALLALDLDEQLDTRVASSALCVYI